MEGIKKVEGNFYIIGGDPLIILSTVEEAKRLVSYAHKIGLLKAEIAAPLSDIEFTHINSVRHSNHQPKIKEDSKVVSIGRSVEDYNLLCASLGINREVQSL